MTARSHYRNLLGGIALLMFAVPGCEPSFPAPKNGYNQEPFPQGPTRLPVATVVEVPTRPWLAPSREDDELVLEIDGSVAANQAFSFQGRIEGIPKDVVRIFVAAGFSRHHVRVGPPFHFRTADLMSCTPENGVVEYRVDVRAPPESGKYYVLLYWNDGKPTPIKPIASAEVVVNEK